MLTIILLSVAGSVLAAIVGTLWYSNATPMGKLHMRFLGFDKLSSEEQKKKMEEAKPMMAKMYSLQFGLSLLTSFAVVFIVSLAAQNHLPFLASLGFLGLNWLCFMVPIIGSSILWGNVDRGLAWKKFFSDTACNLVTVLLIALLARFFV
jgi:hypothetical protein